MWVTCTPACDSESRSWRTFSWLPNFLTSSQLCLGCCLIPYLSLSLLWLVPNLLIRLSIHKPYGYGKSIWNFYMDMDCMDIWITYGHTEINLASDYNTAFQTWAPRYTNSHPGLWWVRALRPSWWVQASRYLPAGLWVLWYQPAGNSRKPPAKCHNKLQYLGPLVGAGIAMPAS